MAFDTVVPTAFQFVAVLAALSVYLGLFHSLTQRNLVRALPAIIVVLASANAVWVVLNGIGPGVRVTWWVPFSVVTLHAQLLGMWKSNLGGTLHSISAYRSPWPISIGIGQLFKHLDYTHLHFDD